MQRSVVDVVGCGVTVILFLATLPVCGMVLEVVVAVAGFGISPFKLCTA